MFTVEPSRRFDRVECDLGDILGTPGNDDRQRVAERLERATGFSWQPQDRAAGLDLVAPGAVFRRQYAAFPDSPGRGVPAPPDDDIGRAVGAGGGTRRRRRLVSPAGQHEVRVQTLRSHRVVGGAFRVHTSEHGDVRLTGAPFGDLGDRDPGPPPRMRKKTVASAMLQQLGLPEDTPVGLEKVVFPMDGGAVWAFLGTVVVDDEENLADVRIHVRADDLALLLSHDASSSAFWGEGTAHAVNPGRSDAPVAVRLPGLLDNDPGTLRGATFDVQPRNGPAAAGPMRDWRHLPDADPGVDEVSAYYHLTATAEWLAAHIGHGVFRSPPFTPLTVVTGHRGARDVVARFMPSVGTIHFGDNPRSAARSRDVCAHELMHAVVHGTRQIDDVAPFQTQSLNEGYADFAQAAMLDDPRMGDWVEPDRHRNCSDPAAQIPADPDTAASIYRLGSAWAGVLWDLRGAVGAEIGDLIALNSLFYLTTTASIQNGLDALLASDQALFPDAHGSGRHDDEIHAAFNGRRRP